VFKIDNYFLRKFVEAAAANGRFCHDVLSLGKRATDW
jgi:hypothetical protein